MNNLTLTLDLNKQPSGQHVFISASDKRAPVIRVYITDNGQALTYDQVRSYSRAMKIRKPNGGAYVIGENSLYGNGSVEFKPLPESNNVGAGETFGYVELATSTQILSTARFSITVLDDAEV